MFFKVSRGLCHHFPPGKIEVVAWVDCALFRFHLISASFISMHLFLPTACPSFPSFPSFFIPRLLLSTSLGNKLLSSSEPNLSSYCFFFLHKVASLFFLFLPSASCSFFIQSCLLQNFILSESFSTLYLFIFICGFYFFLSLRSFTFLLNAYMFVFLLPPAFTSFFLLRQLRLLPVLLILFHFSSNVCFFFLL